MKSPGRAAGGPVSIVHQEQRQENQGWSSSNSALLFFLSRRPVKLILTEGHIVSTLCVSFSLL